MLRKEISRIAGLICLCMISLFIFIRPVTAQEHVVGNGENSISVSAPGRTDFTIRPEDQKEDKDLEKKFKKLREYVHSVMEESKVPGLAIGIVKDGKVIFAEGFGYRNLENKLPVTTQTLFAIGSMTKPFTAMSIGMLVADGKMDWWEPVRTYLPEFTLKDPYITANITLRDLVTHRSGLARYDMLWMASPFSREEIVYKLRFLDSIYGFRERHQYNSDMYIVAGYAAGRVNNSTWDELVKERIFKPLGMTHSNTSVKDSEKDPDHATPYWIIDGKALANPLYNVDNLGPGGSINSCVDDMMKWIQFNLNKGRIGDRQIVPADILIDMQSPHTSNDDPANRMKSNQESFINYGLGWFLKMYRGHLYVGHGGGLPGGFSGITSFMPYDNIGVFVVNNGWSGISKTVSQYAYDLLLGYEPENINRLQKKQAKKTKEMKESVSECRAPTHSLEEFAGTYENQPFGTARITSRNGKLWLEFYTREYELEHLRFNVFKAKYREDMSFPEKLEYRKILVKFCMNFNGDINRLTMPLDSQVDEFVFMKSLAAEVPEELKDSQYLSKFTGKYDLMGEIVIVKIVEDRLIAITPDSEVNEILPVRENEFRLKSNPDYKIMFRMENQKAVEFDFSRPDGVFTGKRIE